MRRSTASASRTVLRRRFSRSRDSPTMQKTLNLKVKYRESFRSLRRCCATRWQTGSTSTLTALTCCWSRRSPSSTSDAFARCSVSTSSMWRAQPSRRHVDYSARVRTVHRETKPVYHELISRFHRLTGCPVVIRRCTARQAFGARGLSQLAGLASARSRLATSLPGVRADALAGPAAWKISFSHI
jgi:hypothetical protein